MPGVRDPEALERAGYDGRNGHRVRILGFVDRIPELLAAADVVIAMQQAAGRLARPMAAREAAAKILEVAKADLGPEADSRPTS